MPADKPFENSVEIGTLIFGFLRAAHESRVGLFEFALHLIERGQQKSKFVVALDRQRVSYRPAPTARVAAASRPIGAVKSTRDAERREQGKQHRQQQDEGQHQRKGQL